LQQLLEQGLLQQMYSIRYNSDIFPSSAATHIRRFDKHISVSFLT
jgi:hypothetical protein